MSKTEVPTYTISEAAKLLDRSPQTLRSWDKKLPKNLRPKRDKQGNRIWTDELIVEIKEWIEENRFYPGNGIAYEPTPERLQKHIARIRGSQRAAAQQQQPAPMTEMHELIEDALTNLCMKPEDITAMLPKVAKETGFDLGEALRAASEVFARH